MDIDLIARIERAERDWLVARKWSSKEQADALYVEYMKLMEEKHKRDRLLEQLRRQTN